MPIMIVIYADDMAYIDNSPIYIKLSNDNVSLPHCYDHNMMRNTMFSVVNYRKLKAPSPL